MNGQGNNFGLLYNTVTVNLGDHIQTLAAKQFLPSTDITIVAREKTNQYHGKNIRVIFNGWFMDNPQNWPPSEDITPLFVSFHINNTVEKELVSKKNIDYFKKHEPIGCRDLHTMEILQKAGVDAYFSGCLTLTLGNSIKREYVSNEILIIDSLFGYKESRHSSKVIFERIMSGRFKEIFPRKKFMKKIMNKIFTQELLENATYLTQISKNRLSSPEEGLKLAENQLMKISSAKFVITSRIHVALPCLAIGVPVIFLNGGLTEKKEIYRLSGLIDLFNKIDIDAKGNIKSNFEYPDKIGINFDFANKTDFIRYKTDLEQQCKRFCR